MPKLKIKGAVKKRLKLTASGRIKRKRAFHSHILTKKDSKRKRRLRSTTYIHENMVGRMKRLLEGH